VIGASTTSFANSLLLYFLAPDSRGYINYFLSDAS